MSFDESQGYQSLQRLLIAEGVLSDFPLLLGQML